MDKLQMPMQQPASLHRCRSMYRSSDLAPFFSYEKEFLIIVEGKEINFKLMGVDSCCASY
jgi:hypothetical protein